MPMALPQGVAGRKMVTTNPGRSVVTHLHTACCVIRLSHSGGHYQA